MPTQKQNNADEKNDISIKDAILLQENLKKDIDFDKPESEMTSEEMAKKAIYQVMDQAIESSVGKEVKNDIDENRKKMDLLSKFQSGLNRLIELGKEIEKNFFWQNAYLINHFDKSKENHFRLVVDGMSNDLVDSKKQMSNSERVEFANNILNIINVYRNKVEKELIAKQEIILALLPTLKKSFDETDFEFFGKETGDINSANDMKVKFQEWLKLSVELSGFRKNAIEAVKEHLDADEILPKFIIESEGDITKNISAYELKSKMERMLKLINEADEAEKRIGENRDKIAEELFGKIETYVDLGEDKNSNQNNNQEGEKTTSLNPLENKVWYRFMKVVYIGLWLLALGVTALIASEEGSGAFIWGVIITWIILTIFKKAFLYIAVGKNIQQ